jgi:Type II secretion system (T2SS), protein G
MFFTLFFTFIFSFLLGLTGVSGQAASARDVERKNDINSIYQKLEEYYNDNGDYPTEEAMTINYDQKLPGLDPEALTDPDNKFINSGGYLYQPSDCTALGCKKYSLSAKLEAGSEYVKLALN